MHAGTFPSGTTSTSSPTRWRPTFPTGSQSSPCGRSTSPTRRRKPEPTRKTQRGTHLPEFVDVTVQRYNPETDDKPRYQTYQVPYREDWVVLDAILYIKDNLDATLSYRWACRMGVCGDGAPHVRSD